MARQVSPASSVTRTLSILGDSWTLLILLNALRGARRFSQWQGLLGIPRPVLSERLPRLTRAKIPPPPPPPPHPPPPPNPLTDPRPNPWFLLLSPPGREKRCVTASPDFGS